MEMSEDERLSSNFVTSTEVLELGASVRRSDREERRFGSESSSKRSYVVEVVTHEAETLW